MTIRTNQTQGHMDRVTIRVPRDVFEWVEALVANEYYPSRSEVWREAARRIARNPTLLWSVKRSWQNGMHTRANFRLPTKLLDQVNDLDAEGWVSSPAKVFHVGAAIVANEYLESVDLEPAPVPTPRGASGQAYPFDPDDDSRRVGWCPDCRGNLLEDDDTGVIGCESCDRRWGPGAGTGTGP